MQYSNVWLATALLNQHVRSRAGESLGKIEDIVVDADTGNIQYAVLSLGGMVGMADKLYAIPWPLLQISSARDYFGLNVDREVLERAPGFERSHWPDFRDSMWRQSIYNYYRVPESGRRVYVERVPARPVRAGISLGAGLVIIVLILILGWMTFLISNRGWEQMRQDMRSALQNAAYAAKETSHDAALTTKVKAALALSKGVPFTQISVESQGDVVTLRGDVPSQDVRARAEAVAGDVTGVREVRNELVVTSSNP
jgi:sporulation protein YlmC with PRC-barrel domain